MPVQLPVEPLYFRDIAGLCTAYGGVEHLHGIPELGSGPRPSQGTSEQFPA
jgi:hypothetical protein